MMKRQTAEQLKTNKIIAIVRGVSEDNLPRLFSALYDGGVRFAEITFDQSGKTKNEDTAKETEALAEMFEGKINIGAGTVITLKQAELAYKAGAKYIISPSFDGKISEYANNAGMLYIAGAMTPTEILTAYNNGADFVKLFPSDFLGLSYIKAVKAPFPHIPLMAFGGIDEKNIADYLRVCDGVGIGAALVNKSLIEKGDFDGIAALAAKFTGYTL